MGSPPGAHRRRALVAVVAALLVALVACEPSNASDPAPADAPAPSPQPTPERTEVTAPLTGLPAEAAVGERAVVAAKLEHRWPERPQVGLDAADVVVETRTDRERVRLLALLHSDLPETVGPLQSARLMDVVLLAALNPVYIAEATAGEIDHALRGAGAHPLTPGDDPTPFTEEPARGTRPEGVYADLAAVVETLEGAAPPLARAPWPFASAPPTEDELCPAEGCAVEPAERISYALVADRAVEWQYTARDRRYRRLEDGRAHIEGGELALAVRNVVVVEAAVDRRFEECCEELEVPLGESGLVGSGEATVHRDGRRYPARWVRDDPAADLRLLSPEGVPVALGPGRTWIVVLPTDP